MVMLANVDRREVLPCAVLNPTYRSEVEKRHVKTTTNEDTLHDFFSLLATLT